jgi:hypothetical protein
MSEYKYKGMLDCFSHRRVLCVKFVKEALFEKNVLVCLHIPSLKFLYGFKLYLVLRVGTIGYLFFC